MTSERKLFSKGVRILSLIMLAAGSAPITGCMSIHTAAETGNASEVKRQLAWGVNPNTGTFPWSLRHSLLARNKPLHFAAANGHIEVVKLLLDHGAHVSTTNEGGETPLHYATKGGHTEVMTILLDHGADVSAKGTSCGTPLQWAARNGQTKAAELLLARGANVNQQGTSGWTALIDAAAHDHIDVVKLLLSRGANPKIRASYGRTALHEAASNDNVEIGRILLAHGADPTAKFNGRPVSEEFLKSLRQPGTNEQR